MGVAGSMSHMAHLIEEYRARCRECGDCLVRCRYMEISRDDAVAAVRDLNAGRASVIHEKCISCYACNAFCPEDAHPYERIIARWNDRYERERLPLRARVMMPTLRPNFRQDASYSREETSLHDRWGSDEPPGPVVLYPGCNLLTFPLLAAGEIFEKLPVWGRWDLCCGEIYFRMGLFGPTEENARRLEMFYRGKGIEEMVFLCPACYNMFTNVLPEKFGVRFDFKTSHFVDWFTDALDRGVFTLKQKLEGSVVIHDSCHARILGDGFMDLQRALLKRLGLKVNETPRNRSEGLCCGMAAGCTSYSGYDMVTQSLRQLSELDRAPGDDIASYCTGCLLTLHIARLTKPFGKRMAHSLELVRRAMGEEVPRGYTARAFGVVKTIAREALPVYFSGRRFTVE